MRGFVVCGLLLAGCVEPQETEHGCPIRYTELGRAFTRACIAEYEAEKARLQGRTVTECYETASGMTCVSG
ncbi:hypothetical protein MACH17_18300 [Phaeobacter inhibens]|nr:hypothetical protein MACH17_18300 [Phaeobacter inhibens]